MNDEIVYDSLHHVRSRDLMTCVWSCKGCAVFIYHVLNGQQCDLDMVGAFTWKAVAFKFSRILYGEFVLNMLELSMEARVEGKRKNLLFMHVYSYLIGVHNRLSECMMLVIV